MNTNYEKPELQEVELVLEGSFLNDATKKKPGIGTDSGEEGGENWD